jgi:hypothetical protein
MLRLMRDPLAGKPAARRADVGVRPGQNTIRSAPDHQWEAFREGGMVPGARPAPDSGFLSPAGLPSPPVQDHRKGRLTDP